MSEAKDSNRQAAEIQLSGNTEKDKLDFERYKGKIDLFLGVAKCEVEMIDLWAQSSRIETNSNSYIMKSFPNKLEEYLNRVMVSHNVFSGEPPRSDSVQTDTANTNINTQTTTSDVYTANSFESNQTGVTVYPVEFNSKDTAKKEILSLLKIFRDQHHIMFSSNLEPNISQEEAIKLVGECNSLLSHGQMRSALKISDYLHLVYFAHKIKAGLSVEDQSEFLYSFRSIEYRMRVNSGSAYNEITPKLLEKYQNDMTSTNSSNLEKVISMMQERLPPRVVSQQVEKAFNILLKYCNFVKSTSQADTRGVDDYNQILNRLKNKAIDYYSTVIYYSDLLTGDNFQRRLTHNSIDLVQTLYSLGIQLPSIFEPEKKSLGEELNLRASISPTTSRLDRDLYLKQEFDKINDDIENRKKSARNLISMELEDVANEISSKLKDPENNFSLSNERNMYFIPGFSYLIDKGDLTSSNIGYSVLTTIFHTELNSKESLLIDNISSESIRLDIHKGYGYEGIDIIYQRTEFGGEKIAITHSFDFISGKLKNISVVKSNGNSSDELTYSINEEGIIKKPSKVADIAPTTIGQNVETIIDAATLSLPRTINPVELMEAIKNDRNPFFKELPLQEIYQRKFFDPFTNSIYT